MRRGASHYDRAMVVGTESRSERKERTRRAILDAALRLTEDTSLVAVSLRQVAKEVGIVPTAFYRHFDSIESLGLALVDESFVSLRAMLRDVRRADPTPQDIADASLEVLRDHVHHQRVHFRFLFRERSAGPPAVREEIQHQISLVQRELATDLARLPGTDRWSEADLHSVSGLIVTAMTGAVDSLLRAGSPGAEEAAMLEARTQLRMLLVGALNWRSTP
jgi:AcrR family transcriptional regulator